MEALKGSWVCVRKIIVVMVYNIRNRKGNHESVVRGKTKSGRSWGERVSTNKCRKQRELENHRFGIPKEIIDVGKDH